MKASLPRPLSVLTAAILAIVPALPTRAQPAAAPAAVITPYAPKADPATSLKDAFKGIFHMGVALGPRQFNEQDQQAVALIEKEFDCESPENVMKWDGIHPRAGNDPSSYNFGPADQYVDFGVKNHMFIIGHNLCWHSQLPGWVSQPDPDGTPLSKDLLMKRLHDHIMTVVGRYKGRVNGWDVMNEIVDDVNGAKPFPGNMRNSVWFQYCGLDYVEMAFKWAHEADPAAELYYNDYNLDLESKVNGKLATAIELVKYLKSKGAPITGVGMQCHYNLSAPGVAAIDSTIQKFADLGMKVVMSEMDVTVTNGANITGAVGAAVGGQPAGRRGAAGGPPAAQGVNTAPPPAPPSLDTLKTALTLTDAQVALITPILDGMVQDQQKQAALSTSYTTQRTAAIAQISAVLNDAQKPILAQTFNPGAGGARGAPGARGGGARGGGGAVALTEAQQYEQAKRYGEIFAVFLKHRDVITRVTLWGLRDPDSWRAQNSPLVFDASYGRKPAYDAIINSLKVAGLTPAK